MSLVDMEQRMGVDWTALITHVRQGNTEPVASYAARELEKKHTHYKIVQKALEEYCFSRVRRRCGLESRNNGLHLESPNNGAL